MVQATCRVNVASIRALPDHKSELLTQLFLNDPIIIEQREGNWVKVSINEESLGGWMLKSQLSTLLSGDAKIGIVGPQGAYRTINGQLQYIHPGTNCFAEDIKNPPPESVINDIVAVKQRMSDKEIHDLLTSFFHAPYMWGGMTRAGIDCSGLSRLLYKFMGIALPQLAREQAKQGEFVDFLANARMGDLAFFVNEAQEVNHVGIIMNPGEIIHASEVNGDVTYDWLDPQGIVNKRTGQHTHQLRMIKRLMSNN